MIFAMDASSEILKSKLPKSLTDILADSMLNNCKGYQFLSAYEDDCVRIISSNEDDANAIYALMKLRIIWHEWMNVLGEVDPSKIKHTIGYSRYDNELVICHHYGALTFKERWQALYFIECFRSLLEKAKCLL